MAEVRLEDLRKHYKRGSEVIRALDGVTVDIGKGEFVAVVGRSGSGKTTMLDLVGLLLRPTSGRLLIDGVDTAKLSDRDRAHMRALSRIRVPGIQPVAHDERARERDAASPVCEEARRRKSPCPRAARAG